ncbi:uncharacterized protein LOC122504838 isoform X2 [Leptopilina heterotoma]|uniref:uncharacterized protein LOC122504838 isoform X2 n=1 Tax=Leptopilina heterotoma TaxID=63436 RepID=UPI001CA946B8|nr:uncharacterized protein LOC122504838 isoform X2 [Leptopilina heterotoma]
MTEHLTQMTEDSYGWHQPDAVCNKCHNFTTDSLSPNRNIFFRDTTFTGMVRIVCNNSKNPCKVHFHQLCWKLMKENLSPIKKLSDKDVIGFACFTPNCESNSTHSVIERIEIIDEQGEVKTVIEGTVPAQPVKPTPVAKGAIRKNIVPPKQKKLFVKLKKSSPVAVQSPIVKEISNYSRFDLESNLLELVKLRSSDFGLPFEQSWKPNVGMYGPLNLHVNLNDYSHHTYSCTEPEITELHNFTFSLLYEYIVESEYVKVSDILSKWNEAKSLIPASVSVVNIDIEIIDFLLESSNIVMIGEYICIIQMLPTVYDLIKRETNGVLEVALRNALNPDDPDLEGEDYDGLFNLIEQNDNANTLFIEPKIQNFEMEYMKSTPYSSQADNDKYIFGRNPATESVKGYDKNFDDFIFKEEEPVRDLNKNIDVTQCEQEFVCEKSNGIYSIENVEKDLNKREIIDEVSQTLRTYFEDVDRKLQQKRKFDSLSTKIELEENVSYMNDAPKNIKAVDNIDKVLDNIKNMDDVIYKQCVDHIKHLNNQIDIVTRKKNVAEQRIAQMYHDNGIIVKSYEEERNKLSVENENLKIRYNSQIQDYAKLRENMMTVLQEKEDLKCELEKSENDKIKVTGELQSRSSDLEKERESSLEWTKMLFRKWLDEQLKANGNLLNGHIEQCNTAIHVFNSVNKYANDVLRIKLFPEMQEWYKVKTNMQEVMTAQQNEHKRLVDLLNSKTEFSHLDDFNLKISQILLKPAIPLAESVHQAFQISHRHIVHRMSNIPPPHPRPGIYPPQMDPRFPPPPMYLMNHGYQGFPRQNMMGNWQQQVRHPQQFMNMPPPPPVSIYNEPNRPLNIDNTIVMNDNDKTFYSGSREDLVNDNDVSLNDVVLEEKDELSEASSLGGSTTSLSTSDISPQNGFHQIKVPKYGADRIMEKLRLEFVGVPEYDLIDCILQLRKDHHNSLSGTNIFEIINEARQFVLKRQRQHIFDYNDTPNEHKENNDINDKIPEIKDNFHPFGMEKLRKRNNSVSSSSSIGAATIKIEAQTTKKSSGKSAWVPIKASANNWTKDTIEAECNICFEALDQVANGKSVSTLDCQHSFHKECIKQWLNNSRSCPNCREYATHHEDYPPLP